MLDRAILTPASTDIPENISVEKCLDLVMAANSGNMDEVVRLLKEPDVDMNFMVSYSQSETGYGGGISTTVSGYHSALSAAIVNKKNEVACYLLECGAVTETTKYHYSAYVCKSILALISNNQIDCKREPALFKMVLRRT